MKNAVNKRTSVAAAAGICIGLCLLFFPLVSDLAEKIQNEAVVSTMESRYQTDPEKARLYSRQFAQALRYNRRMAGLTHGPEADILSYEKQLDADGEIMGYVRIPAIGVLLPIYHGTDEDSLMAGAGHLPESSLPAGGSSSHCIITAHSGMKTMKAFDDLRMLKNQDEVILSVMGRELTYRVTGTETVLPEDTESLKIKNGKDLLTLVTCTPYGINTHRLLVHCSRSSTGQGDRMPAAGGPACRIRSVSFVLRHIPVCVIFLLLFMIALRKRRT